MNNLYKYIYLFHPHTSNRQRKEGGTGPLGSSKYIGISYIDFKAYQLLNAQLKLVTKVERKNDKRMTKFSRTKLHMGVW